MPRAPGARSEPATGGDRAAGTYAIAGRVVTAPPPAPGLHVVATPIGHLGDVTLRALETLAGADLVACEDTRVTAKLFERYMIRTRRVAYHEHNAAEMRPKLMERLTAGASIALVSDAGTPLVSDPGFKLVEAVREAGLPVIPVPGASAVLAALVAAGLPTDRFFFEGFLPAKSAARRTRLAAIGAVPATIVAFETGPRLAEALSDVAAALPDRTVAVCRELTKTFEEVVRGAPAELAGRYADVAPKGEIVLVIGPPAPAPRPIRPASTRP